MANNSRFGARIFATLALLIGLVVLIGWVFHYPFLTTVFPGYVNMKFNTALCFVLCGTALLLGLREPVVRTSKATLFLSAIVALIALMTLAEYLFNLDLKIDQIVYADFPVTAGTSNPGRMAPNSAFIFLLISIALMAQSRGGRGIFAAQLIAVFCFFNILIPAAGYFFHAQIFISVFSLTRLAIHTIVGFYFLIFAILLARLGEGLTSVFLEQSAAGHVSRRFLVPVLVAPPLIGGLCYLGYEAQLYDLGFLCSLFVFCITVAVFGLTVLTIVALQQSEAARQASAASETEARINEESALEATRLKSSFLAMMSHEIRNPMNSVLGYSSLLRHTSLDEEQREYVSMINSSGEVLLRVVDDVLDHARIEAGRFEIVAEEFDPGAMLKVVEEQFTPSARTKGLTLILEKTPNLPPVVLGDEKRLRQILANLISNAIKFTTSGKIIVQAKCLGLPEQPGRLRLDFEVRDTGSGIHPEDLDKLFQPFSQVGLGRRQRVSSSGLGLAICRELTHLLDGDISVSSEYGKGSTFRFDIVVGEVAKSTLGAKVPPPEPGVEVGSAEHALAILVAEDDRVTRLLMDRFLKKFGYSAQFASNGKEAVQMASEQPRDVIFMDVNMPILDGLEASRLIRKMEADRGSLAGRAVIIGLTANVFDSQDSRFREADMDECLLKPINYEHFAELLKSIVSPASSSRR